MAQIKEYLVAIHTDENGKEKAVHCHINDFDDTGYHKDHRGEFGWRYDELEDVTFFKYYHEAYNTAHMINDPECFWNEMKIHGL